MSDRHFDQLATRFAEKIYGGAKGAIRLAVLQADLIESLPDRPLRVLDIGAGLGHMSLWLAERGHDVTLAEPAAPMLEGARQRFADAGQTANFIQAPWQALPDILTERYDLVICHAVLEWLDEPFTILPVLHQLTKHEGWLSLAFYNRDALIYRNLLKGHFRKMRKNTLAGEKQSLTPQEPVDPRDWRRNLAPCGESKPRVAFGFFTITCRSSFRPRPILRISSKWSSPIVATRPSPDWDAICTGCAGLSDPRWLIHAA